MTHFLCFSNFDGKFKTDIELIIQLKVCKIDKLESIKDTDFPGVEEQSVVNLEIQGVTCVCHINERADVLSLLDKINLPLHLQIFKASREAISPQIRKLLLAHVEYRKEIEVRKQIIKEMFFYETTKTLYGRGTSTDDIISILKQLYHEHNNELLLKDILLLKYLKSLEKLEEENLRDQIQEYIDRKRSDIIFFDVDTLLTLEAIRMERQEIEREQRRASSQSTTGVRARSFDPARHPDALLVPASRSASGASGLPFVSASALGSASGSASGAISREAAEEPAPLPFGFPSPPGPAKEQVSLQSSFLLSLRSRASQRDIKKFIEIQKSDSDRAGTIEQIIESSPTITLDEAIEMSANADSKGMMRGTEVNISKGKLIIKLNSYDFKSYVDKPAIPRLLNNNRNTCFMYSAFFLIYRCKTFRDIIILLEIDDRTPLIIIAIKYILYLLYTLDEQFTKVNLKDELIDGVSVYDILVREFRCPTDEKGNLEQSELSSFLRLLLNLIPQLETSYNSLDLGLLDEDEYNINSIIMKFLHSDEDSSDGNHRELNQLYNVPVLLFSIQLPQKNTEQAEFFNVLPMQFNIMESLDLKMYQDYRDRSTIPVEYKLCGFVCHLSNTTDSGHYIYIM